MKPHPNNSCAGKYSDWLEVMLLPECNGSCSWCVEKNGFKPLFKMPTRALLDTIIASPYSHIHLLGGEPTLHPDIYLIIKELKSAGKIVSITSNGSFINTSYPLMMNAWPNHLNLSIHNYDLNKNKEITGIDIYENKT
jgi:molybdenum cofactor biosynthesis enzyme MoaA